MLLELLLLLLLLSLFLEVKKIKLKINVLATKSFFLTLYFRHLMLMTIFDIINSGSFEYQWFTT